MTTNRTPIQRPALTMISPRAVALYVEMGRLRCTCAPLSPTRSPCPGCARWFDLHNELHMELRGKPWEWPCVVRQSPKRAGSTCMNETIAATMALLDEAVDGAQQRQRAGRLSAPQSTSPQSNGPENRIIKDNRLFDPPLETEPPPSPRQQVRSRTNVCTRRKRIFGPKGGSPVSDP
jgi:hypothetical protein